MLIIMPHPKEIRIAQNPTRNSVAGVHSLLSPGEPCAHEANSLDKIISNRSGGGRCQATQQLNNKRIPRFQTLFVEVVKIGFLFGMNR
jgi:hypothetical protein